jgi:hypothetical protein
MDASVSRHGDVDSLLDSEVAASWETIFYISIIASIVEKYSLL